MLVPGLDPRQGGVQVSAIDALTGKDTVRSIVYGTDPGNCVNHAVGSLVSTSKLSLVCQVMTKRWTEDVAVFWHCSMLRLLPFLRGFRGKKVVFLHGIEVWRPQPPSLLKKLESVDLFLSNSDFTWNRFLDFVPQLAKHKQITTPLGFGNPANQNEASAVSQDSVLIIARMHKAEDYKGHRQLIRAWPQVLKRVPTAKLDIVGEGDLKADLQQLAVDLGVQANVRFHGRVDEVEKENLLRTCSIFAMPSRGEGFGIVYLEAMRYGRPCIVSNCDAAREVVNPPEAGLEVDPDNIELLSNSIADLLTDQQTWLKLSAAARSRYQSLYTVDAYRKRLWSAIESVLSE